MRTPEQLANDQAFSKRLNTAVKTAMKVSEQNPERRIYVFVDKKGQAEPRYFHLCSDKNLQVLGFADSKQLHCVVQKGLITELRVNPNGL